MTPATEYRVRWQREGRRETTRIFQSWSSAIRKARAVLAADGVACDPRYINTCEANHVVPLPRLVSGPTVEGRPVGAWGSAGAFLPPASDGEISDMAWHMDAYRVIPKEASRVDVPF